MVNVALVLIAIGVNPSRPKFAESAMLKHAASAAAINSSGFAPGAFSKRVENVILVSFNAPLVVDVVPTPLLKSPFHVAVAVRIMSAMCRHSLSEKIG